MDDVYAINLAKTEIREAYNKANPDRLLAVVDEGLIDFSDHRQTAYSQCGKAALRAHLEALFSKYHARLVPIIIEITITGETAVEYGWHELTLTPKAGGEAVYLRTRYLDLWKKDKTGQWKLAIFMDNADVPDTANTAAA
jgi:ketosteroid isomerase-like protein